jgi:hypothetical protein
MLLRGCFDPDFVRKRERSCTKYVSAVPNTQTAYTLRERRLRAHEALDLRARLTLCDEIEGACRGTRRMT